MIIYECSVIDSASLIIDEKCELELITMLILLQIVRLIIPRGKKFFSISPPTPFPVMLTLKFTNLYHSVSQCHIVNTWLLQTPLFFQFMIFFVTLKLNNSLLKWKRVILSKSWELNIFKLLLMYGMRPTP